MGNLYEIRRGKITLCVSSVPNCGYTKETIRDMERSGLYLYRDGKREKATAGAGTSHGGRQK
jgi:hypothetical protein